MLKRLNKKGISPLIATVLLIGATVGIFLIVFTLIRGVTVGSIEKSTSCGTEEAVALDIAAEYQCTNKNGEDVVEITVTNNGQVKVEGYLFVFYKGDQGKAVPPTLNPAKPGQQSINDIAIADAANDCPDRIEVYPGVVKEAKDQAKFLVCKDKKIEVTSQ